MKGATSERPVVFLLPAPFQDFQQELGRPLQEGWRNLSDEYPRPKSDRNNEGKRPNKKQEKPASANPASRGGPEPPPQDKLTPEEEDICRRFHWDPKRYLRRKREMVVRRGHALFSVPMSMPLREQIKEQIRAWPGFVPEAIGHQTPSRAIRGFEMRDLVQCAEADGVPLEGFRAILTRMQVPVTKAAVQVLLDHSRATSLDANVHVATTPGRKRRSRKKRPANSQKVKRGMKAADYNEELKHIVDVAQAKSRYDYKTARKEFRGLTLWKALDNLPSRKEREELKQMFQDLQDVHRNNIRKHSNRFELIAKLMRRPSWQAAYDDYKAYRTHLRIQKRKRRPRTKTRKIK